MSYTTSKRQLTKFNIYSIILIKLLGVFTMDDSPLPERYVLMLVINMVILL